MGGLGVVLIGLGLVGWGWVALEFGASLGRGYESGLGLLAVGAAFGGFAAVLAAGAAGLFVAGVVLVAADQVRSDLLKASRRGHPTPTAQSADAPVQAPPPPGAAADPLLAAPEAARSRGEWVTLAFVVAALFLVTWLAVSGLTVRR